LTPGSPGDVAFQLGTAGGLEEAELAAKLNPIVSGFYVSLEIWFPLGLQPQPHYHLVPYSNFDLDPDPEIFPFLSSFRKTTVKILFVRCKVPVPSL
jgi:hypothetical protein